MNVAVHDELMESLAELRRALPSMRLGQLIANMATVARGAVPGAIWEMEDDELLGAIRWQLQQLSSPTGTNGPEQISSDIKAKRNKKGMSLDALAKEAGLSKSYLWELENRDSPRPSLDKLQAIAKDFTCGSKFTQTSVQVEGHRISVTFAHEAHPDAICPAVLADYGPEFDVPALAAGNYQVFANRIFPCAQGQICPLLAIAPQLAGRLASADPATGIDILYPPTVKTPGAERGDAPSPRVRWRGGTRDLSGRLPARR